MPIPARALSAVALIAALCATTALPQERAAPRPELRFEPQEVKVQAGGATEPVVVTLTLPPGVALPAESLPLTVGLSRAIESLVTVEPEQPVLSLGRDGIATARLVFGTDAATPRARYRVSVVAQPRPFQPVSVGIPALAPNQSTTLTLAFTRFTNFMIPGFKTQQDPYMRIEHWLPLYVNGTGVLSARTSADASVMEGDEKLATKAVACGPPANANVQMPAAI